MYKNIHYVHKNMHYANKNIMPINIYIINYI